MIKGADLEISTFIFGHDSPGVPDIHEYQTVIWSKDFSTDNKQNKSTRSTSVETIVSFGFLEEIVVEFDATVDQRRLEVLDTKCVQEVIVQVFFEKVAALGASVSVVNGEQTAALDLQVDQIFVSRAQVCLPLLCVQEDADTILVVGSDSALVRVDRKSLYFIEVFHNRAGLFERRQLGLELLDVVDVAVHPGRCWRVSAHGDLLFRGFHRDLLAALWVQAVRLHTRG